MIQRRLLLNNVDPPWWDPVDDEGQPPFLYLQDKEEITVTTVPSFRGLGRTTITHLISSILRDKHTRPWEDRLPLSRVDPNGRLIHFSPFIMKDRLETTVTFFLLTGDTMRQHSDHNNFFFFFPQR